MSRPEIQPERASQTSGENSSPEKMTSNDGVTLPEMVNSEQDRAEIKPSAEDRENTCILPPGQHPCDPAKADIDAVGFALDRVQTFLVWIDEHRASFEKLRHSDQQAAEAELSNLRQATMQGMLYLQRLSELLLAGYTFDSGKRLPESLQRGWFSSWGKQTVR